jgi:hypothetical protein
VAGSEVLNYLRRILCGVQPRQRTGIVRATSELQDRSGDESRLLDLDARSKRGFGLRGWRRVEVFFRRVIVRMAIEPPVDVGVVGVVKPVRTSGVPGDVQ